MLSNEWIVWLIFRFVDLLIIIGLSVYGFRRWGLPLIKKNIDDEQQEKQDLLNSVDDLQGKAQTLDQKLQNDNEHIAKLEHQVRIWQETPKRKQNRRLAQKEDIKICLEKKYAQRAQGIQEQLVFDAVVPKALKQAEDQLTTHFSETKNKLFVDNVMQFMKEQV